MEGIESTAILGKDGAFQSDWRDQAFPGDENKDIRENPTLSNIKDVRTMARSVIDSQSQIAKITGGREYAILPNEQSTPEEVTAHRVKMGMPKTHQEYGFGDIEGANPKFVEKMGIALHSAGCNMAVAAAVAKAYGEFDAEYKAEQVTEGKIADAKADKAIRTELGSAYDQTMQDAQVAISIANGISPEFAKELSDMLPFNRDAAMFLAKVGSMVSEDPGLKAATGTAGGLMMTPADALAKAEEVKLDPYWSTPDPVGLPRSMEKHNAAQLKSQELFNIAYPS